MSLETPSRKSAIILVPYVQYAWFFAHIVSKYQSFKKSFLWLVSVIFHRDIKGQRLGKICAEKMASLSKQNDTDQALAILLASDDDSIDSLGK